MRDGNTLLDASFYQDPEVRFLLKNFQLTLPHSEHQTASSILSNYAVNVDICHRINYFQILDHSNLTFCHTSTSVKVFRETNHNAIFARLYVFG